MFLEISSGSGFAPVVGVEPRAKTLVDLVRFEENEPTENKEVVDSKRSQKS